MWSYLHLSLVVVPLGRGDSRPRLAKRQRLPRTPVDCQEFMAKSLNFPSTDPFRPGVSMFFPWKLGSVGSTCKQDSCDEALGWLRIDMTCVPWVGRVLLVPDSWVKLPHCWKRDLLSLRATPYKLWAAHLHPSRKAPSSPSTSRNPV